MNEIDANPNPPSTSPVAALGACVRTADSAHEAEEKFVALVVSRQLIRQLRPIVVMIRRHDADLARQLQRAASSVHLNLSESQGREGGDRRRFFEFAAGSAYEVRGALQAADDWGWIGDVVPVHRTAHRMIALLWGLRRPAP